MYLTRIRVEIVEALGLALSDAYAWHQRVWTAFPGRQGQMRDFLSRTDNRDGLFETLVLSPDQPEAQAWGEWETRALSQTFMQHRHYLFSLRANPTVKRVVRDHKTGERKKNGRRTRICSEEALREWLERKGGAAGFSVAANGFSVSPPVDQTSWRRKRRVTHARVDFAGALQVTDHTRFIEAYRSGIGPSKAFGFGLLMLKPDPLASESVSDGGS